MAEMIVEIDRTKVIVTMSARTINSNAIVMEGVYLVPTNVTEIKIVLMDLMKMMKFVVSRF